MCTCIWQWYLCWCHSTTAACTSPGSEDNCALLYFHTCVYFTLCLCMDKINSVQLLFVLELLGLPHPPCVRYLVLWSCAIFPLCRSSPISSTI